MNTLQILSVAVLPLLFAITVHEAAHGWAANRLGDPTARMLGRLSLNPIKHIDPLGTIVVPLAMVLMGGVIFGWAKPVPVTVENLRRRDKDMALVALAGPMANLVMALFWALMMKLGLAVFHDEALLTMAQFGIAINLLLMMLNLLPIPPLDGSRILAAFLPGPLAYKLSRLEPYGLFIVLALVFTGLLGAIILPPIGLMETLIYQLFSL